MTKLNALAAVVALCAAGSSHMTQAAEPETLTLACQGTVTDNAKPDAKPEPISMGIVFNFTARTVNGFPHEGEAEITWVDDAIIVFVVKYHGDKAQWTFDGNINRVTGDLEAHSVAMLRDDISFRSRIKSYSLKCKPTQRMF